MAWFELESGKQLYYEEFGKKGNETIIFINGIVYTTASWYYQKKYLIDRVHVICYDMRCQGKSSKEQSSFDYSIHVEDLKQFIEHLDIEKPSLAGLSYGTFVSKEFAVRYPEMIKKLILMVPLHKIDFITALVYDNWQTMLEKEMLKNFYDFALYLSYSQIRQFISDKVYKKSFEKFKEEFDCQSILYLLNSFDRKQTFNNYHEITIPTLIIGAENDTLHNPQDAKAIHEEIAASKYLILKGGHAINLENYKSTNAAIAEFILEN